MSLWTDQNDSMLRLCVESFGSPVTYQRAPYAPFELTAIFGHPNQEDTEVQGQGVTLDVRIADFLGTNADPLPLKGDTVTITDSATGLDDNYTVYLVQVDAEGAAKLWMTKIIQ